MLDPADVVVTKLKRFHGNDQADIQAMIDGEHIQHERVVERFRSVIRHYRFDARAQHLERMAKNLNEAERDWFLVDETAFPELEEVVY